MANPQTSRTVVVLSRGARLCLMAAALLLIFAWYVLYSGIQRPTAGGNNFPFLCGNGAHPPTDSFPKAACGYENRNRQYQAIAYGLGAAVVGLGGLLTFGSTSRQERARQDAELDEGAGTSDVS